MNANLPWIIVILDCHPDNPKSRTVGDPITCTGWNVISRLACVRRALPPRWHADAYPSLAREVRHAC